jgi:hypothetical protein
MPSVSRDQQQLMQGALTRRMQGMPRSTDPKMSTEQLADFANTNPSGLPQRKNPKPRSWGDGPVSESI